MMGVLGDNEIRQGSRMEWVKNGTDIESTYDKVSRSWVELDVTRKREKKAGKKKGTASAKRTSKSSDEKKCR